MKNTTVDIIWENTPVVLRVPVFMVLVTILILANLFLPPYLLVKWKLNLGEFNVNSTKSWVSTRRAEKELLDSED